MAEHTIETRILLRYDTFSNWMNSNVILKQGEAAIAAFPYQNTILNSDNRPTNTPPAIGMKIGDGTHYFRELPWIQAVSADVYAWAKDSTKPSYTAQEIYGLQNYVENLINNSSSGGDSEITIAPRIYSLVQGTNDNANKYYLRYKENIENSEWIVDTSQSIDLSDLVALINWITRFDMQTYSSLSERTDSHINFYLNKLNVNDNDTDNNVVTAVSQTNGKINITKRQLNFNDINGTLDVSKGGTGASQFSEDEVLIGNGMSPITTLPIDDEINATQHLVYNYAIKAYIDNAVAGLTGAMHFIGEAGVIITQGSTINPNIAGYNFSQAQPGDVILYDAKEFVWTGSNWRLLGDEGSYAIKGSITNVDIADGAEISQSKITNLTDNLNNKVDKEEGKGLSSNDYTTEEKQKLSEIENNAQRNIIEHVYVNGFEALPTVIDGRPNSLSLRVSALTPEEEEKIAGIENGAQANRIEHIFLNSNELNIGAVKGLSKSVNLQLTEFTDQEKEKLAGIENFAQVNTIEKIFFNETEFQPNNEKEVHVTIDEAALNLQVIKGARVPAGNGLFEDVDITNQKKLNLARIAKTGNIADIIQTNYNYVTLDCGSSTEVL